MNRLVEMRSAAGPRLTVGLNDAYIEKFLARDINLALAINNAYSAWQELDAKSTYKKPEGIDSFWRKKKVMLICGSHT